MSDLELYELTEDELDLVSGGRPSFAVTGAIFNIANIVQVGVAISIGGGTTSAVGAAVQLGQLNFA
jgi:hypothetical protein